MAERRHIPRLQPRAEPRKNDTKSSDIPSWVTAVLKYCSRLDKRVEIMCLRLDILKFKDMPREIRDMIYEFYLFSDHHYLLWYDGDVQVEWWYTKDNGPIININEDHHDKSYRTFLRKSVPRLFKKDRQSRNEVIEAALRHAKSVTIYSMKSANWFRTFLDTFESSKPFDLIKTLAFTDLRHYAATDGYGNVVTSIDPMIDLALRCPNLRCIYMNCHFSMIMRYPPNFRLIDGPEDIDTILSVQKLRPILQCRALETVQLDEILPYPLRTWARIGGPTMALNNLGVWIKESFEAQGQEVEIGYGKRDAYRWPESYHEFFMCRCCWR